jgi:hypothetical protein
MLPARAPCPSSSWHSAACRLAGVACSELVRSRSRAQTWCRGRTSVARLATACAESATSSQIRKTSETTIPDRSALCSTRQAGLSVQHGPPRLQRTTCERHLAHLLSVALRERQRSRGWPGALSRVARCASERCIGPDARLSSAAGASQSSVQVPGLASEAGMCCASFTADAFGDRALSRLRYLCTSGHAQLHLCAESYGGSP